MASAVASAVHVEAVIHADAGSVLNHQDSKPAGAAPTSTLKLLSLQRRNGRRWGAAAAAASRVSAGAPSHAIITTTRRRGRAAAEAEDSSAAETAAAAEDSSAADTTSTPTIIGTEVVSVEPVANKDYYNLTLKVPSDAISAVNYTTPGQSVALRVSGSPHAADPYYVASAPSVLQSSGSIEFLVHNDASINTADALIASTPGTTVELTPSSSPGFNLEPLYPVEDVQTVLLFASGFALGPVRALIETGFDATKRTEAKLYYFYASADERAYTSKYEDCQKLGVTVVALEEGTSIDLNLQDASKTAAVICVASPDYEKTIKSLLADAGVPSDKIVTLF